MKPRGAVVWCVSIGLLACAPSALSGCGSDVLPEGIVGSYAREEAEAGGARSHRLELNVTATGIAVTGPAAAAGGAIKTGSELFEKLKCSDETSCRFTTKSACEGTIAREASGAIVIVAVGSCDGWSGKWAPSKPGDAAASASASASGTASVSGTASAGATTSTGATGATTAAVPTAPAGTAVPTAAPTATATSSGTATSTATSTASAATTAGPLNVSCLAACNSASIACVKECKVGDLECLTGCSAKVSTCAAKCP